MMVRRSAAIVPRKVERSGSKGCPLTGAYVSSAVAKSYCILSDFMVGEVRA